MTFINYFNTPLKVMILTKMEVNIFRLHLNL